MHLQGHGAAWGRSRRQPGAAPERIGPSDSTISTLPPSAIRLRGRQLNRAHAPRLGWWGPGVADRASTFSSGVDGFAGGSFPGLINPDSRCGLKLGRQPGGRLDPSHGSLGIKTSTVVRRPRAGESAVRQPQAVRCGSGPLSKRSKDSRARGLFPVGHSQQVLVRIAASGSPGRRRCVQCLARPHPAAPRSLTPVPRGKPG